MNFSLNFVKKSFSGFIVSSLSRSSESISRCLLVSAIGVLITIFTSWSPLSPVCTSAMPFPRILSMVWVCVPDGILIVDLPSSVGMSICVPSAA